MSFIKLGLSLRLTFEWELITNANKWRHEYMEDGKKMKIDQEDMEKLAGKFSNDDNQEPHFSEELSDGGERNRVAKEQLKRITLD